MTGQAECKKNPRGMGGGGRKKEEEDPEDGRLKGLSSPPGNASSGRGTSGVREESPAPQLL